MTEAHDPIYDLPFLRARLWRVVEIAIGLGHRVAITEGTIGWPPKPCLELGFDFYPDQNCDHPDFYDVTLGTKAILHDDMWPYAEHWLRDLERRYGVRT